MVQAMALAFPGQTHHVDRAFRSGVDITNRNTMSPSGVANVVEHGGGTQQRKLLRQIPEGFPNGVAPVGRQRILTVERHITGVGQPQSGQYLHQRRLAGTVDAQQGDRPSPNPE